VAGSPPKAFLWQSIHFSSVASKNPSTALSLLLPSIASDRVCQLAEVRISFLQTTCFQSVGPEVS
jgi:hypothetical protein